MGENNFGFSSWKDVILNFFENKISTSILYKTRKYIEENQQKISSEKDNEKQKKLLKRIDEKKEELKNARVDAPSTEIRSWLDDIIKKSILPGERIIKATHLLKFGHSSALSEGIFLTEKSTDKLLTTSSIKKDKSCDMAHNNGNLITISRFFALNFSGEMIIDLVLDDKPDFLRAFASNDGQLNAWMIGLKQLVERREIKTADKAKQVYFPVTKNMPFQYHLLTPLLSSSIAEAIYKSQAELKFGQDAVNIRKAMYEDGDEAKFYDGTFVNFPKIAVQKFGGAQPQNVSMLNKSRTWKSDPKDKVTYGVAYMLNCQPPIWRTQEKLPILQTSFFDTKLRHKVSKDEVDYLRDFLIRFEKIDISIKHPDKKKWIDAWVGNIIDDVLAYVSIIQNIEAGWSASENIKLKREHQLFLDPYREDDEFQIERKSSNWQMVVCEDFARWLNKILAGKDRQFTGQSEHTRMWVKLIEEPLREHDELISLEIKLGKGKV